MAAFKTFTISQPFLGAPLQFQPALGSKELEELIDAYVIGTAPHNDKLSEVTIDFFNNATVDLNTGARVRRYDVFAAPWLNQSPVAQSPFTPPIFTPSPASTNVADSGYGSINMTQPARKSDLGRARVAKHSKKDTKKAAEIRLPGFSILTKDGVDVTNCASRGTKTKEQREHAHLMRIMKACNDCKKKKIRCDPSHRRSSQTDMSRTSTSTTTKTSSSSNPDPSPTVSVPSLSFDTAQASQENSPADFNTDFAIDDFVLFPDEDLSAWNPADTSIPGFETQADLRHFNFDLNGFSDMSNYYPFDHALDFQGHDQSFDQSFNHNYFSPQLGSDQWAVGAGGSPVAHNRPHHFALDGSFDLLDEQQSYLPVSHSKPHLSTSVQDSERLHGFVREQPDNLQGGLPITHSRHPLAKTAQGFRHLPGTLDSTTDHVFRDPVWLTADTQAGHWTGLPRLNSQSSLSSDELSPLASRPILTPQPSQASDSFSLASLQLMTPQSSSQSSNDYSPADLQLPSPLSQSSQLSQSSRSSTSLSPSALQLPITQSRNGHSPSLSGPIAVSTESKSLEDDVNPREQASPPIDYGLLQSGWSPHGSSSSPAGEQCLHGHEIFYRELKVIDMVAASLSHAATHDDHIPRPTSITVPTSLQSNSSSQAQSHKEEISSFTLRSNVASATFSSTDDVVAQSLKVLSSRKNLSRDIQSLQTELCQLHGLLIDSLTAIDTAPSRRSEDRQDRFEVTESHLLADLQAVEDSLEALFIERPAGQQTEISRPSRFNRLNPELHEDHLKACQANIRRLVRSLCATFPSLEDSNSGCEPDISATSPGYSLPTSLIASSRLSSARTIYDRLAARDVVLSGGRYSTRQPQQSQNSDIVTSSLLAKEEFYTAMPGTAAVAMEAPLPLSDRERLVSRSSHFNFDTGSNTNAISIQSAWNLSHNTTHHRSSIIDENSNYDALQITSRYKDIHIPRTSIASEDRAPRYIENAALLPSSQSSSSLVPVFESEKSAILPPHRRTTISRVSLTTPKIQIVLVDDVTIDASHVNGVDVENIATVLESRTPPNVTRDISATLENSASLLTFFAFICASLLYAFTSSYSIDGSGLIFMLGRVLCLSVMMAKSPSALRDFVDVSTARGVIGLGQVGLSRNRGVTCADG